ncbi:MAG: RiPP maturation radical SAM C-methyltransferase [Planctomycetes bacterium]|nr:RiPP maturation radical SAM C-methyltransferase [Planctomycetota bacterium]
MIYLVNMPFMSLAYPALGLPTLAGILKQADIPYEMFYENIDFAGRVGLRDYEALCTGKMLHTCLMEWLFADRLRGITDAEAEVRDQAIFAYAGIDQDRHTVEWLTRLKREAGREFLDSSLERLRFDSRVKVVGFSCLFQIMPSLELGFRIKQAYPDCKVVYGGPAFHDEAGEELFEKMPWIDAVSTGEADDIAAELFQRLSTGESLHGLQGTLYRDADGTIAKTARRLVSPEAFDTGTIPDFDSYFTRLRDSGQDDILSRVQLFLPFESSRGCWWHEKNPCTFCGLNGVSDKYRVKNPENVVTALKHYHEKYGAVYFGGTDNNLSMTYFNDFFPLVRKEFAPGEIRLFYCVKSNLGRNHIREMAESGVFLAQPGIESLSDNLLRLMSKGVTALQNVRFLKCARQFGIFSYYYLLLRMYGETQEDYDEMAELVPRITHLTPPGIMRSYVNCHTYSVYYELQDDYFTHIEPAAWYRFVYPEDLDFTRLAYNFDVEWRNPGRQTVDYNGLVKRLEEWRRLWRGVTTPDLYIETQADDSGDRLAIIDSRDGKRTVKAVLNEFESRVYDCLDDIVDQDDIVRRSGGETGAVTEVLGDFVRHGFALRRNNQYLGLALRPGFRSWSFEERSNLLRN